MKVCLRRRHLGRLLCLAVTVALLPLPAFADEGSRKTSPGIRVSAAAIAKSQPLEATAVQSPQEEGPAGADSPSFFKRPVGIVILATFAAGVGYALYSVQNDRITSPAKQ
jgi:hypothetical protein